MEEVDNNIVDPPVDDDTTNDQEQLDIIKYKNNERNKAKKLQDQQNPVNYFDAEAPLYVYRPSDPASAVGYFTYEFGHYFSYRMGEAHPTLTLITFLVPVGLFGTAGLASVGVAANIMNKVVHTFSTALTANGHFVMSTAKLEAYVKLVDHTWLSLTGGLDGSAIEVLLMCGFGLPKICYLIAESALNTIFTQDDETTMETLAHDLSSESTEGSTDGEERKEALKTTVKVVGALSAAAGLGIVGNMLVKKGLMKFMLDTFDNVKKQPFKNLDSDIIKKCSDGKIAVDGLTLVLTMKTAAIFLGKLLGVSHFMHAKDHPQDVKDAIEYFRNLDTDEIVGLKNEETFQKHYRKLKSFEQLQNFDEQQMGEIFSMAVQIDSKKIPPSPYQVSKYFRKGHELEDYAAITYFERLRKDKSERDKIDWAFENRKNGIKDKAASGIVKEFNQMKYTMECIMQDNPYVIDYFHHDGDDDIIGEVLNHYQLQYTEGIVKSEVRQSHSIFLRMFFENIQPVTRHYGAPWGAY
ncbi:MAG: hypothetical protein GY821_01600 [Gammaproteobacteria bacterium]|nr:hypothetical protein [Gammaproteobacteria bacterium]